MHPKPIEAYMRLTEIMERQERRFTRNQERTDGIKYTLNQNNEQKSLAGNKSQVAENVGETGQRALC